MAKITVATKVMNKFLLHKFLEGGGTIVFNKYNFGLEIGGKGDFRELKLITFPETEKYTTIIESGPRKKKKAPMLEVDEEAGEEI